MQEHRSGASAGHLVTGTEPRRTPGYRQLEELLAEHGEAERRILYQTIELETPLEEIDDDWSTLRCLWDRLEPLGVLTVYYGRRHEHRLHTRDVTTLARLAGFEPSSGRQPARFQRMELRKRPRTTGSYSCSVVVPCRNEADNVEPLFRRLPDIGTHTELIFVDGASTDGTVRTIETLIRENPERDIRLLHQTGPGAKAAAVYQGFDASSGDTMMILDADMTVAPEDLPRFYLALAENVADFANGTRFVYPMDRGAMRSLNNAGNRVFGIFLSWLLGTHISDSLCGTKALFRKDWPDIASARPLFGGHDPWGDFDLLLGAAYRGLRLVDVPVRYGARTSGESKMHPFRHGAALGRTCIAGVRRLKWEKTPAGQK